MYMNAQIASDSAEQALSSLALPTNNIMLYSAGLPNYPANFTRDSIISGILMHDAKMLRDQLVFCALLQGGTKNPFTGEEPGKIFHEMPAARIDGLSSEFNACDTTALFIIGHEVYLQLTNDDTFITRQKKYLEKAVTYILSHIKNNLFVEDPAFCGAKRFALRVTYWKDSQVPNRHDGIPAYPAVYTLAHVQNMRALKSAAALLDASDLLHKAFEMNKYLSVLYDQKKGMYAIGIDQKGFFPGLSSDNLHMLYYLEPDEITPQKVQAIVKTMQILETQIGYLTFNTHWSGLAQDITTHTGYHTNTVWPFEQALIHSGAKKFGLTHVMNISSRIAAKLDTFAELYMVAEDTVKKSGSATQLWTIAAQKYFYKEASKQGLKSV